MNIFISWSNERSKDLGKLLHEYLSVNLQKTKPWLSSHIEKGKKWHEEITSELGKSNFGLIILTPENLNSAWILFEAGALSKLPSSRVFTVLFDLEHNDIKPPLSQFQHTIFKREDFKSLIKTINNCCFDVNKSNLEDNILDSIFNRSWDELDEKAREILNSKEISSEKRTTDDKINEILSITRALEKKCNTVQIDGKFYQKCNDGRWIEVVNPVWDEIPTNTILEVQKALNKVGFIVEESNRMDQNTKEQLVKYQKKNKLSQGALDFETLKSLGLR